MALQKTNSMSSVDQFVPLFDWRPDLARFEREVETASRAGVGDALTLGEMQCSLDLIDAELLALRSGDHRSDSRQTKIQEWLSMRGRLARLISKMEPLIHD